MARAGIKRIREANASRGSKSEGVREGVASGAPRGVRAVDRNLQMYIRLTFRRLQIWNRKFTAVLLTPPKRIFTFVIYVCEFTSVIYICNLHL